MDIKEESKIFSIEFHKSTYPDGGGPFPWKEELCNILNESKESKIYFIQGLNVGKTKFVRDELRIKKVSQVKEDYDTQNRPDVQNNETKDETFEPNIIMECTSSKEAQYGIFHVIDPSINVYVQDFTFATSQKPGDWPYGIFESIANKKWVNTKYKKDSKPSYEGITHVLVFSAPDNFPYLVTEYGLPLDLIELYQISFDSKNLIKLDKKEEYNNQLLQDLPKTRRDFKIKYSNVNFNNKLFKEKLLNRHSHQ